MDSNLESGEGKSANEGKNRVSEYGVSTDLAEGMLLRISVSEFQIQPVFRVY